MSQEKSNREELSYLDELVAEIKRVIPHHEMCDFIIQTEEGCAPIVQVRGPGCFGWEFFSSSDPSKLTLTRIAQIQD